MKSNTFWTEDKIEFLRKNYQSLTNKELADSLNMKITRCRMKLYELGLKRIEMEYFTAEQIEYLKANYRTVGDVELAERFEKLWPKNKPWIKQHICKKRKYLKLTRTADEIKAIKSNNCSVGGSQYTIERNSASKNLPDGYIANMLSWRDLEGAQQIKKHYPHLIELKRQQILLTREIKKHEQTNQ